jgi:hypothetical protein
VVRQYRRTARRNFFDNDHNRFERREARVIVRRAPTYYYRAPVCR